MKDCLVSGTTISGATCIGGVAGWFKNTASIVDACTVDNCEITATDTNLGGIVGRFDLGEVKNSTVKGGTRITGTDSVGGVAGRPITRKGDCLIDNCFVTGGCVIKGKYYLGGIAGYVYPDSNYLLTIANCGFDGCTIESTAVNSDDSDSKCGGIAGYVRLTDANSNTRILNCYAYFGDAAITVPASASAPSVGGIFGYAKLNASSPGYLQVSNCSSNLSQNGIVAGSSVIADASASAKVGGLYGHIVGNSKVTVEGGVYVSDSGLTEGSAGDGVVLTGNAGFPAATFTDGSTVLAKLNSFVLSFSGYALHFWGADSAGLPVFSDANNVNGVEIDYDDNVIEFN